MVKDNDTTTVAVLIKIDGLYNCREVVEAQL
jgi:hypothetical protein